MKAQKITVTITIEALSIGCLDNLVERALLAIRSEYENGLNKVLGPYWKGFVTGLWAERETILRGKMNDAFGHEAVRKAEGK